MVTQEQIMELVEMVFAAYPNYANNNKFASVCNLYHLMFKDEDYSKILKNLKKYMMENDKFAPKPKDLLNKEHKSIVPSHAETMAYLDSLEPKERLSREEALELARKAGLRV